MRLIVLALLTFSFLTGCASNRSSEEMTEADHYRDASESLERKAFLNAIEALEELQARFPYGDFAEQAQLDLIYARYRSLDYPGAAAQADRFIRTFGGSDAIDYALYMKGLANYYLNAGLFERFMDPGREARDLQGQIDAFRDFDQLVRRFPDSEYAEDARARMLYIRQLLAAHELEAARYYARRGAHIAAANRAQFVVRHYQGTPAVEEALAILGRAYRSLEQSELEGKSTRVLATNFPESEYLDDEGQIAIEWWPSDNQRNWLSLITFDLL